MNLALEKGERVAMAEVRLEVRLERSLGWFHMCLPQMAWEKGMKHLMDVGTSAGKMEILLVVGGFDVDRGVNKDVNIQEGDN